MSAIPGNLPWLPLQEASTQTHMYQICPYICTHWPPTTDVDTSTKKFHCHVLCFLPGSGQSPGSSRPMESSSSRPFIFLVPLSPNRPLYVLWVTCSLIICPDADSFFLPLLSSLPPSSLTSTSFLESLLCAEHVLPTPTSWAQIWSQTTWVLILPPSLPSFVISGK